MVVLSVTVRSGGLHPFEACKAWYLVKEQGLSLSAAATKVVTVDGHVPKKHALRNAIKRVASQADSALPGQGNYSNCGRAKKLTTEQVKQVVAFVKKWRHKRFCTCRYIIQELKLSVSKRTVARVLNENGFFWKPVPKQHRLKPTELARRRAFVDRYVGKTQKWWEENMNLVLDGVTLTMPPKTLSGRQKHAAQRIDHMWLRHGERLNPDVHTYNRYGVQLGTKVPLWGGFTGGGHFTLRLWTPRAKMLKAEWEKHVPKLKRAVDTAEARAAERRTVRAKVWHDNEKFLLCPATYRRAGLTQVRFPPNSGDLNPIETVWAKLRDDLALREQEDLVAGRVLTVAGFRHRVGPRAATQVGRISGRSWCRTSRLAGHRPEPGRREARRARAGGITAGLRSCQLILALRPTRQAARGHLAQFLRHQRHGRALQLLAEACARHAQAPRPVPPEQVRALRQVRRLQQANARRWASELWSSASPPMLPAGASLSSPSVMITRTPRCSWGFATSLACSESGPIFLTRPVCVRARRNVRAHGRVLAHGHASAPRRIWE